MKLSIVVKPGEKVADVFEKELLRAAVRVAMGDVSAADYARLIRDVQKELKS